METHRLLPQPQLLLKTTPHQAFAYSPSLTPPAWATPPAQGESLLALLGHNGPFPKCLFKSPLQHVFDYLHFRTRA